MNNWTPIHYTLRLEPDLDHFTFTGEAEIHLQGSAPSDRIILNALDLTIRTCTLVQDGTPRPCAFALVPEAEQLVVTLPTEASGSVRVRIAYSGEINNRMAGFYRSAYGSEHAPQFIGVTQFQESDARRAFPCFDHPVHKATFAIEMRIDPDQTAVSNCAVADTRMLPGGKRRVRFAQTPKMSTYLVFWGVGGFKIAPDALDPRVRTVVLPGREAFAAYGLDFGRKALAFCEAYFAVAYPLAKLDLIAVPDFAYGAMENWGAITFRENLLLHDPSTTSRADEERICEVIAHEIVHQWFGNLVTPSEWKFLWLNESFATYFGFGVVAHHYPEWDTWHQFLNTMTAPAMDRDALAETFPIEIPGGSHVVINAATAPIIYNKGGGLLRQIEGYIGSDLFRKGLRYYLEQHAYACASSRDLWEAFEKASEKPVTRMVQSWIAQPGFPLITVDRRGNELVLTQSRFTYLSHPSDQTWLVPIRLQVVDDSGESKTVELLMEEKTARIAIGQGVSAYWIDPGRTGFFRVAYTDTENLARLGERISGGQMAVEDRWGLENDLFAVYRKGDIDLEDYLQFLDFYRSEEDFLPAAGIADHLFHLYRVLPPEEQQRMASMGRSFTEGILRKIGFVPSPSEPHTVSLLRDRLIWHAALYGSAETTAFAGKTFQDLQDGRTVSPDIQKSVLMVGAREKDLEVFNWLENRFKTSPSEHDRINILTALGCFRKTETLEQALAFALTGVPDRNKFLPIVSAAANPAAAGTVWRWYLSHLDALEGFHPLLYERVIAAVVPVCGLEVPDTVEAFFREYLKKKGAPAEVIRMSLERLDVNRRLRERRQPR